MDMGGTENPVPKPKKPGQFVPGDARCWRQGRPKTFDALRELAQRIANEPALANGHPIVLNGHVVTVAEAIMRQWATSGKPQLQQNFVEVAYGRVPAQVEIKDWRSAARREGIDPDEALNEIERIIAAKMGSGADDCRSNGESDKFAEAEVFCDGASI